MANIECGDLVSYFNPDLSRVFYGVIRLISPDLYYGETFMCNYPDRAKIEYQKGSKTAAYPLKDMKILEKDAMRPKCRCTHSFLVEGCTCGYQHPIPPTMPW